MTVKYMGSKRAMLKNGLGELLNDEVPKAKRFADLFAGSGAVSTHVARNFRIPVLAFDLQQYSSVLTDAVIGRDKKLNDRHIWHEWKDRAQAYRRDFAEPTESKLTQAVVKEFRKWAAKQKLPITSAYGGHYFSPTQSIWIDALRATVPDSAIERTVALASLLQAASHCAASPGHTAQPFQPTKTAKSYIERSWAFDVVERTRLALETVCEQHANQRGSALVCDANEAAKLLTCDDIAFIDPPYSGEHYSRFYHVLETIAAGKCGKVSGVGRYPEQEFRPKSRFCLRTQSADAVKDLFSVIAARGAKAIVTFPDHACSNGLSGESVRNLAQQFFQVQQTLVDSDFSTLGGTGIDEVDQVGRHPRLAAKELMLVLKPK